MNVVSFFLFSLFLHSQVISYRSQGSLHNISNYNELSTDTDKYGSFQRVNADEVRDSLIDIFMM